MAEPVHEDRAEREARTERVYPVLGRKVNVRFLGHEHTALADELFAGWDILAPNDVCPGEPLVCDVIVSPNGDAPAAPPAYRVTPNDLCVETGPVTLFADRAEGRACLLVSRAALAEAPRHVQRLYLEPAVLFLASARDRVPVHAAAALVNNRPVLLAGASGSGKSTLLYALHTRGCPILAEESTCVSTEGGFALWGLAREIGMRAAALPFFPALASAESSPQPNGKEKFLAPLAAEHRAYPRQTGPCCLVFLVHAHDSGPSLRPVALGDAHSRLLDAREPGFDLAPEYSGAIRALLANAVTFELPRMLPPLAAADLLRQAIA